MLSIDPPEIVAAYAYRMAHEDPTRLARRLHDLRAERQALRERLRHVTGAILILTTAQDLAADCTPQGSYLAEHFRQGGQP